MEKGIIIVETNQENRHGIGAYAAYEECENRGSPQTETFDGSQLKGEYFRFLFDKCTPETKIVIVHSLREEDIETFCNVISNGMVVEKKGAAPFVIKPLLILTVLSKKEINFGKSITRRFTIKQA